MEKQSNETKIETLFVELGKKLIALYRSKKTIIGVEASTMIGRAYWIVDYKKGEFFCKLSQEIIY